MTGRDRIVRNGRVYDVRWDGRGGPDGYFLFSAANGDHIVTRQVFWADFSKPYSSGGIQSAVQEILDGMIDEIEIEVSTFAARHNEVEVG